MGFSETRKNLSKFDGPPFDPLAATDDSELDGRLPGVFFPDSFGAVGVV